MSLSNIIIVAIVALLPAAQKFVIFLFYRPFVFIHHSVCFVMQMHCCSHVDMYWLTRFRGLCHTKVIYTELSYWKKKRICQCQTLITLADWHGQHVLHWQITHKFVIEYWSWLVNKPEFVCKSHRFTNDKKTKLQQVLYPSNTDNKSAIYSF